MSGYQGKHRDNTPGARVHCTIADTIARTSEAYDQWAYEGKHRADYGQRAVLHLVGGPA